MPEEVNFSCLCELGTCMVPYACGRLTQTNSCIDLDLFAEYSEQKRKPWEHLENGRGGGGFGSAPGSVTGIHTCMHKHTSHMCGASLGSQSAALNKAPLFLPLIAGSICRRGVEFLISALTERGEMGIGKNTKWMHLLTNEIKPLHLHHPPFFFRQLEQYYLTLA